MERCSFVLKRKNRKCRMLVKSGHKFCGEHAIYDPRNEERIVCPNDPKHTVRKSELHKHLLSRCNSRLRDDPWIIENINVSESPVEMESWYRPKAEELIKMRTTVERIYDEIASNIQDSFLQNMDIEAYAEISTKLDKKHIRQISSIIEHLVVADLVSNDERWCLIDLGAGRAELSYWMAKIAPKCRFLLVERMGSRNKFDNKAHKEIESVWIQRLRCSVEHLDLSKIGMIQNMDNITAVCKHFCGAATDYGIRCLLNGARNGLNICGFALAPCCHHRTTYGQYFGRPFLEAHGIVSASDFAAVRHISTWAVCGFPDQDHDNYRASSANFSETEGSDNQTSIPELDFMTSAEKEVLGQKAKAILEYGRAAELEKFGYDVMLYRYVKRSISPENFLIVGIKR